MFCFFLSFRHPIDVQTAGRFPSFFPHPENKNQCSELHWCFRFTSSEVEKKHVSTFYVMC